MKRSASRYDRALIYERDGYKCLNCDSEQELTIDHVIPICLGGCSKLSNYQTLCVSCNGNKSDNTNDFRYKLGTKEELKEWLNNAIEQKIKYTGQLFLAEIYEEPKIDSGKNLYIGKSIRYKYPKIHTAKRVGTINTLPNFHEDCGMRLY